MPVKKQPSRCPPKTAVAYARYSSAGQRDVSIDQQLSDIRAYAAREGYTIVHEYADRAKSGYKKISARAEFQAMMAAAADGEFDTVIAWKVDRFGRNRRDAAIYKGQLKDHGVRVIYAMEPIPPGAAGVLTEGMLESIAEWYSCNLSENIQRGQHDNALKAISNGVEILGYRRGPDGRYEIEPDGAAIIRDIFARYNDGFSAGRIAKDFNAAGLRTARGCKFSTESIIRILSYEQYTGVYIWKDIRIPGGMPAIISKEDFERAQIMKTKTNRHVENHPVDFILTGKVFCGLCGHPMVGDSGRSANGKKYYYYTCKGFKPASGTKRTCSKKSVRKDALEKTVLDFIYQRCLTGPEREKIADAIIQAQQESEASSPRAALSAELKDTEKRIGNVNDAIESGIWNESTRIRLKSLEDRAASLRASIAELDFSRDQLLDRDKILYYLSRMSEYKREDPARQVQLISTFINSIFVFDDYLKIVINAVEGAPLMALEDLEPDTESSNSVTSAPRYVPRPNRRVVVYTVRFTA